MEYSSKVNSVKSGVLYISIYLYIYPIYHQIISNKYCRLSICGVHNTTVFYNPWAKIDQPFLGYPPGSLASPRGCVAAASTRPFTLRVRSNHHTTTSPVGPNLWPVSNIFMEKIRLQTPWILMDMSQVYGLLWIWGGIHPWICDHDLRSKRICSSGCWLPQ